MIMPVRIFRHVACEGPGYLGTVLERRGIPYEIVAIDRGEPVPADLDAVTALVFMGGPMSVNDDLPWIQAELELIRRADERDLPLLGHCLGGQLLAKALGGQVSANPVKEIGWLPVSLVPGEAANDWLAGVPAQFTPFHWHGETFTIPDGSSRLLESPHCPNQAFVRGNVLAFQCHVEMTAEMVSEWARLYADEIRDPSPTVQSATQMTKNLDTHIVASQAVADRLYARWLATLDL
jgi:GMP synthase-like glutamine amidotransferase